jgi:hypothetical protein
MGFRKPLLLISSIFYATGGFMDAFIEDTIEANGCYCGGGGKEDKLSFIVELGRRSDDPDSRLHMITEWLDARPDVEKWRVGEEFDIWHGDYKDINDEIERPPGVDGGQNGVLR